MPDEAEPQLALASEIAARLAQVSGVVAVSLGGSLARGRARLDSDIDLGLYYRPDRRPELECLREAASEVGGAAAAVTPFGAWGPWINGGAWLNVQGQQLDWLYRDLDLVEEVFDWARQGRTQRHAQPGHPHGFHTHIYLGEVHYGKILYDPEGELERLQKRLDKFPPELKSALVATYLWQAQFALDVCLKSAARGEAAYVAGCLFESAYCLVQVLYALNERYFINEKGALAEVGSFALCPSGFTDEVSDVLGHVGESVTVLDLSRRRIGCMIDEVRQLSDNV